MAVDRWTVLNEATQRYQAHVRGRFLMLLLGEADTAESAESQREMRLKCELAEQFALILGDTLEARVLAVRTQGLSDENHERTVTQAEVAALAKKLRGPAIAMRKSIQDDDRAVLWVLLSGARDQFLQALDRIVVADTTVGPGRRWPGTRAELHLYHLARAWHEVYGEEPTATAEFVLVVEATLTMQGIQRASELEDWTARSLKRLQTSFLA